jgi:dienelactone hydrolase
MKRLPTTLATALFALACLMPALALGAVKSKTIEYTHEGTTLKGQLYWDDAAKGKRPGVMVVHEWWGLNDYAKGRAEMLARLGYVALAADMYGQGQMTTHAPEAKGWMEQITANVDAWRGRALAGLAALRAQPQVDPARVAAIGYCFGGATVMQMAYAGADLSGVASFHGSLPPAPQGLAPGSIKPKVLAAHGAADTFVPAERVQAFQKGLEDAGAVWEFVTYGGTKHSFTNPEAAKAGMEGMAYNQRADRRSWELLQSFLKEVFQEK